MTDAHRGQSSVPVADFLREGREQLSMELVAGASAASRRITEAAINRPGLALTGFFKYFAHRRIQVLGLAEQTYLRSLDGREREQRLRDFFERKIPCVVVSRNKRVLPEIKALSEEYRIPVLRTSMITKHFINAATIIMENLMAPRLKVQGTMVEIMGIGVLIEGKAGLGKSETALGLIKRGHALVSDDITALRLDSAGSVLGSPVSITRYHMEIRGVGIIHVPSLFGVSSVREEKKLDMVATLCARDSEMDEEALGEAKPTREILGVRFPRVVVRVLAGRDLVNVIEAAALDHKLKKLGHDAVKELDEKIVAAMSGGKIGSE